MLVVISGNYIRWGPEWEKILATINVIGNHVIWYLNHQNACWQEDLRNVVNEGKYDLDYKLFKLGFFFAKVFREKTLKPYTQVYDLNVLCVMLPNEQIKL